MTETRVTSRLDDSISRVRAHYFAAGDTFVGFGPRVRGPLKAWVRRRRVSRFVEGES